MTLYNTPFFTFIGPFSYFISDSLDNQKEKQAELLRKQGNEHFKDAIYSKSIELYTQSISVHPTSVCYGNRSFAYFKLHNYEASLEDATNSLQYDEQYYKGYFRRAEANMALENYELAISDFEKFHNIQPNSSILDRIMECKRKQAEVLKEEGNKVLKAGDIKMSIELYTKSIGLFPTSHCYGNRSYAFYKIQNFENSVADATESLRYDNSYSKGYLRRADAHAALKNNELAINDYISYLKEHPTEIQIFEKIQQLNRMIETGKKRKWYATNFN